MNILTGVFYFKQRREIKDKKVDFTIVGKTVVNHKSKKI